MENGINTGFNRRNLFKTGLTLAGGALLPVACKTPASASGANNGSSKQKATTVKGRRKLGGTLEVSSVGLGVQNMSRTYQTTVLHELKCLPSSGLLSTMVLPYLMRLKPTDLLK